MCLNHLLQLCSFSLKLGIGYLHLCLMAVIVLIQK